MAESDSRNTSAARLFVLAWDMKNDTFSQAFDGISSGSYKRLMAISWELLDCSMEYHGNIMGFNGDMNGIAAGRCGKYDRIL